MEMSTHIEILGKPVEVRLSRSARRALAERNRPLLAEMELLFSCLIRKRVRFRDPAGEEAVQALEHLYVRFRPVMTQHCAVSSTDGHAPVEDFPVVNPGAYVPHWLALDFAHGAWQGEFGY